MFSPEFYRGRRVLVTGHTGFKGAWLCRTLLRLGADVYGFSLPNAPAGGVYEMAEIAREVHTVSGDIRDLAALREAFCTASPEVVFHLAAQPLVREGYNDPVYTYEVNVLGTVHVMECVRDCPSVRSAVIVTTDKVYENDETGQSFCEGDRLDGFDPYANSKSCAELVTACYARAFLSPRVSVSTVRAGNVIGGGDVSCDRILPDCVRAALACERVLLRSPHAVRPYQHVLEPIFFYLALAARQYEDAALAGSYNVGPRREDHVTTAQLAACFARAWGEGFSASAAEEQGGVHEATLLYLDCAKAQRVLGWQPKTNVGDAVRLAVEWEKCRVTGEDIRAVMDKQIDMFLME